MIIDLTQIVQAILTLLATLITARLIPWIKARTNSQQQAFMQATIHTLVYAAEQIYGAGRGEEKLLYVKKRLEEHGYRIDSDQIEAAVREMSGSILATNNALTETDSARFNS